jgi:hypothetical protein
MEKYIHIGFPKTATTTLQDNVFAHHSGILYLGKSAAFKGNREPAIYNRAALFMNIWRLSRELWNPGEAVRMAADCVLPYCSSDRPNVISLEEFSYATPRRWDVPKRLKQVFGDARIIMTIRSQYDSLVSAYYWKSLNLELNADFDGWFDSMMACAQKPLNRINQPLNLPRYYDVVRVYAEVFGKENICIIPFEWLRNDSLKFVEKLSDFIGIGEGETHRLLSRKRQNIRQSELTIKYQRQIKKTCIAFFRCINKDLPRSRVGYYNGAYENGFHGIVSRLLNRISSPPQKRLTEAQTKFILGFYGKGNTRLMEEYNLDLKTYGYPCA